MKKILVLILIAVVLLGSFSTAYAVAYTTLHLEVEEGGAAVYNDQDYWEGVHDLNVSTGSAINLEQYSNAGYKNNGIDKTDDLYRVKFEYKGEVYGQPYYSTDGTFSGYYKDDDGEIKSISNHNPRGDILQATMEANPDKNVYLLGEMAQITLNINVDNGDNETDILSEVDLYKDGVPIQEEYDLDIDGSIEINDSCTLPSTESDLKAEGSGFTYSANEDTYTKTIKYELVDRYNDDGGSAIIAQKEVDIIVDGNATIYVTGDDEYTIYLNGKKLGSGNDNNQWTKLDEYRVFIDKDDYLIAVKGEDTADNIAGITVTVQFDDGSKDVANNASSWVRTTETEVDDDWYKVNYKTNDEWLPVTDIDDVDGNWITTNDETNSDPQWIWSDKYKDAHPMDDIVYFRSEAPEALEEYTQNHPYQFFNFFDMWEREPTAETGTDPSDNKERQRDVDQGKTQADAG